jgi:hypothetical protein
MILTDFDGDIYSYWAQSFIGDEYSFFFTEMSHFMSN